MHAMSMEKTIRKFSSQAEQKAEVYRYWRSRPPAERFLAVWDATFSAYAFANALRGCRNMILPEDLRQLLLALNAHGVEYLVVGGWAVGYYADPRSTKDIDIFIRSSLKNSEALFRALAEFGAPLAGVTASDFHDSPTSVFQIGFSPARVDLLQSIDGVDFDEAWKTAANYYWRG